MRLTLRSKILFYLLFVSLCGIFFTSLAILWGFENSFNEYIQKIREENSALIEGKAVQSYKETGRLVNNQLTHLMHQQAMMDKLFYRIYNEKDELLADTTMLLNMMGSMGMHSDTKLDSDFQKASNHLTFANRKIGRIEVYYPKEMIGEDVVFFETIKSNVYFAIVVTVSLAFLFSLLFSKRLTSGFQKLSKAIQKLQDRKWRTRVSVEELPDEMKQLGESFNQLAESLSKEVLLRKQFTADFAHEIRTPLATLRSQIEAYQDAVFEPTPTRLQQSHAELMRLVRLVNELEVLIAAENPHIKLNKINLELGCLLLLMEEQFTPAFQKKGVHLNIQKPTKEYWVKADRDRIVQILTNVINNSLQYTPAGKMVSIALEKTKDDLGFSVKDEGIGIVADDLPYLFERFYRGDKSRDRKSGGMGIGLSIVKALVDAHKGKIQINSRLNVGTVVTILLPKR